MAKSPKIPAHKPSAMNTEPMTYPTALPSSLSADARTVYDLVRRHTSYPLDRDLFDPQAFRRYLTNEDKKAFVPTERMLAAIDELSVVRLVKYSAEYGHTLHVSPVREDYTVAQGRGSSMITVSTFARLPDEAALLATILGGDVENRGSGGVYGAPHELVIRARHEDATDFEESASSTALLVLRNPSTPHFNGYGVMTFTGVLTEARLYPLGLDPLTYDDGDTPAGETCTRCKKSHPFAAYQPPTLPLGGPQFALVQVRPLRGYKVAAPPAYDQPETEEEVPA